MAIFTQVQTDSIRTSRSVGAMYRATPTAADLIEFKVGDSFLTAIRAEAATVAETTGIQTTIVQKYFKTDSTSDEVRVADVMAVLGNYRPTVADLISIATSVTKGQRVTATDGIGVASLAKAAYALRIIEELGLTSVVLGKSIQKLTVAETTRLLDSIFNFFAEGIAETVGIGFSSVQTKLAVKSATDSIGIAPSVARVLVLRISATDRVNIDDIDLEKMLFRPSPADLIEISAAYIAPNDVFTTWNVNAITGAVSQYDNYSFNSFANFGQMYIGADENGLYELNGCNDEGSAIIARIKSGLAQLTESRFTMIRDAYIGMRSDGTFVLRITTGEKEVYDYTFDNQNMKTTRVQLGKGMRTRYASFELISTGSDFDLDSVEFIPLSSVRRV